MLMKTDLQTDTFLSAKQLNISEETRKYLIKALEVLPRLWEPQVLKKNKTFGFYMNDVLDRSCENHQATDYNDKKCDTAGCILGLMEILSNEKLSFNDEIWRRKYNPDGVGWRLTDGPLRKLFYPDTSSKIGGINYNDVTNDDAAITVRHFLLTGKIDWSHVNKPENKHVV